MDGGADDGLQPGDGGGAVGEGVVERCRREPDDVRPAEIRHDARGLQGLADPPGLGVGERDVAAAPRVGARIGDGEAQPGQLAVGQLHQERCQREGLCAQGGHAAGLGDELERAEQGSQAQHVRRADVQGRGVGRRLMLRDKGETPVRPHAPPAGKAGGPAEVAAVEIQAAHGTGAGIEVFVVAPEGEVGAVAIKGVGHGADRVRAIPADHHAAGVRLAGDRGNVEQLPAHKQHGGQHRQLHVRCEGGDNVVRVQRAAVAAPDEPQVAGRVEPALAQVALHGVQVGGEVEFVGHDDVPGRGRIEQRGEQLVQVRRGRAGHRHLVGRGADERGDLRSDGFAERDPGRGRVGPAVDAEGAPFAEDTLHVGLGTAGQQAERVAVEVDLTRGQEKLRAEPGERVGLIQGGGGTHRARIARNRVGANAKANWLAAPGRPRTIAA